MVEFGPVLSKSSYPILIYIHIHHHSFTIRYEHFDNTGQNSEKKRVNLLECKILIKKEHTDRHR